MRKVAASLVLVWFLGTIPTTGADLARDCREIDQPDSQHMTTVKGRASIISGDELWFPQYGEKLRLEGIDTCALPQWSFDPWPGRGPPAPVPCGAFAKAWLKRVIGGSAVVCGSRKSGLAGLSGRCSARGHDLALEMLRIGLARVNRQGRIDPQYLAAEHLAQTARDGMWGAYVLDMGEWDRRAIDRTVQRRPFADWNLLRDREHEITPPFADWRDRPRRTDR
jgi:endonuclease YncB( thermonuclease family)